jgi:hypothetical protein
VRVEVQIVTDRARPTAPTASPAHVTSVATVDLDQLEDQGLLELLELLEPRGSGLRRISRLERRLPQRRPTRNQVSMSPLPLTVTTPRRSNSNWSRSRSYVSRVTCTRPGTPVDSIRLAVFTVSPQTS